MQLAVALTGLSVVLVLFQHGGVAAVTPPNVLIILTDDVGWGDVGYNCKNETVCPRTRNIDHLATGPNAVVFNRFYAGAGVCSPTRASVLTGRSNYRGCIASALPCDHMTSGAANCSQGPGLSQNEFTIAKAAAKAGMASIHIGKWHLGDLWDKHLSGEQDVHAWPAGPHHSSPGDHGFSSWYSSQSQLPTSTPNCGCFPPPDWAPPSPGPDFGRSTAGLKFKHSWPGEDCVVGGGMFVNESDVCSTYWHPDPTQPTGVSPLSKKIPGDDGAFVVETLGAFVQTNVAASKKWLATLWLHYIHLPHPAMPAYYSLYKNDPDYVGTLHQLDDTIGDIVEVLEKHGVVNDTLLFFTSDNGPHCTESTELWPEVHCGGVGVGRSSGGLRGCKASNWEGGIRVPGFLVWPDRIKRNIVTDFPAVTHDYLPTILEAFGVASDHPDWPLDGISLMPFTGDGPAPTTRSEPIGFWWGSQKAWIDNDMKLVENTMPGQGCPIEPPYKTTGGTYLYNLTADVTESVDLKQTMKATFVSMTAAFGEWTSSVTASAALNNCGGKAPRPPAPPVPPTPPAPPAPANCTFEKGVWGFGADVSKATSLTLQGCCDACRKLPSCTVAVYEEAGAATPDGVGKGVSVCHIKAEDPSKKKTGGPGYWACRARNTTAHLQQAGEPATL